MTSKSQNWRYFSIPTSFKAEIYSYVIVVTIRICGWTDNVFSYVCQCVYPSFCLCFCLGCNFWAASARELHLSACSHTFIVLRGQVSIPKPLSKSCTLHNTHFHILVFHSTEAYLKVKVFLRSMARSYQDQTLQSSVIWKSKGHFWTKMLHFSRDLSASGFQHVST